MRILKTFPVLILSMILLQVHAQTETPKGFKKGNILLADSSIASGSIKENIRSNASVQFIGEAGGKKKIYNGSDIISLNIEGDKFLCINGDFFKIISHGELCFLQKLSDASGKPSYNGNVAVFSSGTEGKPDDYFLYDNKSRQLKLVSKKNYTEVTAIAFAGYTAALDKAKSTTNDIAQLKEAVDVYNSRTNK